MADNFKIDQLNEPLSYTEWLKTQQFNIDNESEIFARYKKYVSEWYNEKNNSSQNNTNSIKTFYSNLLKEITINYSTTDERRFLENIDFSNKRDIDIVIPFFVKKIKQITQYFIKKRQEIKFAKTKANVKGSVEGTKLILKKIIIDLISNDDFASQFSTAFIPTQSDLADNLVIQIEDLYDTYDNYFDINPNVDKTKYVSEDDIRRLNRFTANVEDIDPLVFIDFDKAVQNVFNRNAPALKTSSGKRIKTASNNLITIRSTETDITKLPASEFVDATEKTKENLNIVQQGELVKKFSSTKFNYLSTGSTATSYVTGDLFEPYYPYANLSNTYYPSHATIKSKVNLKSVKEIGGFYTPEKLGVLNFASFNPRHGIDERKLEPNKIYIFPDPEFKGPGRGDSLTDNESPIYHNEDVLIFKADISNDKLQGYIAGDEKIAKFYSYQSHEETELVRDIGISRSSDSIDFWSGDTKNIWANQDIYPLIPLQNPNTNQKLEDFLSNDLTIHNWSTDIYGHEFALFKKTNKTRLNNAQNNGNYTTSAIFSTVDTSQESHTAFDLPKTKFYDYSTDKYVTKYVEVVDTLSAGGKTVYESVEETAGKLFFRDVYSSIISPVSSALSGVFIKYENDSDIISQINGNIKNFNIYRDVICIETENYLIFEKYEYDFETRIFNTIVPNKVFIQKLQPAIEKFADPWYDELNQELIICKTTLHPYISASNYKAFYPTFYSLDLQTFKFTNKHSLNTLASGGEFDLINDPRTGWSILSAKGYTLFNSGLEINITSIDKPIISFNPDTDKIVYNCIASDACNQKYIVNFYYDRFETTIDIDQLHLIKPSYTNILNGNFSHYYLLSGYINAQMNFDTHDPTINSIGSQDSHLGGGGFYTVSAWGAQGYFDIENNTYFIGASTINSETDSSSINPYMYNTSYVIYASAIELNNISEIAEDVIICFDFAVYTNLSATSASGFVIYDGNASVLLSDPDNDFILTENGNTIEID